MYRNTFFEDSIDDMVRQQASPDYKPYLPPRNNKRPLTEHYTQSRQKLKCIREITNKK